MNHRKENHEPEATRIGKCVLQVSTFYRKFPESSDEAVSSFIKVLAGSNGGVHSKCASKVQRLHESDDDEAMNELFKIKATLKKKTSLDIQEAVPKRHSTGLDSKNSLDSGTIATLKSWVLKAIRSFFLSKVKNLVRTSRAKALQVKKAILALRVRKGIAAILERRAKMDKMVLQVPRARKGTKEIRTKEITVLTVLG